jgi:hypothetical protein
VLDHARAGDLAFLGDVADQNHRRTCGFRVADDGLGRRAHLSHRAGCRFGEVGPQRLDGIENDEVRSPAVGQRGKDILDIGFRREFDRSAGDAEPLRPQPHLRDRLFARDVDDAIAFGGQSCRRLHQQRRLADAGIAAHQDGRAAHEAAAGGAVELGDP